MFEPTEASVLVCDPHVKNRATILKFLSKSYVCEEADSFESASEKLAAGKFAAVIADTALTNELEFLSMASFQSPETAVILTTAHESSRFVAEAFRAGVFDVLLKPFDFEELEDVVVRAVAKAEALQARSNYYESLESMIAEGTTHLENALDSIENSYGVTLKALIQALETRDAETHGHAERVVTFSLRLGHECGLDKDQRTDLELGALVHDIGKIGVPDAILRKPAKLNEREWEKMKLHPLQGHRILRNIPFLEGAAKVVLQHHERWDGTGYPNGLRGNDIDITARVFSVADAFDAMTSDRIYSRGKSFKEAFVELKKCAGTQFDPGVVEAFNAIPRTDWEILHKRSLQDKQELFSYQAIVQELVESNRHYEMVH